MTDCGGCQGIGSHKRWCREAVGPYAAMIGPAAEQCEDLADRIGPNDMGASNILYAASSKLRERALRRKAEWQAEHGD